MNKIRKKEEYIDIIIKNSAFFKQYYFHSIIDLNLIKLDLILNYGILSKNQIEQKNLPSLYTHDSKSFDSKNGSNYISLAEYTDCCKFNSLFESFTLHTLSSLSLLVNKNVKVEKQGERGFLFDDELLCPDLILPSELEGIIFPEHLSMLPISRINCLPNDLHCYTKSYLNHWIASINKYFSTTLSAEVIHDIKISYEQLWDILEEYENPNNWIESAIKTQQDRYGKDLKDVLANILQNLWAEKFYISNPTFMEIVMRINEGRLPIYEMKQKSLKRII